MSVILSENDLAKLRQVVRLVLGDELPRQRGDRRWPRGGGGGLRLRSAKVISVADLGSTGACWTYTCRLGLPSASAPNAFVEDDPVVQISARNKFEVACVAQLSGIQPDGIDQREAAGYPQGFRLRPVAVGAIVTVWQEPLSDGTPQWWFDRVLAHGGSCT